MKMSLGWFCVLAWGALCFLLAIAMVVVAVTA